MRHLFPLAVIVLALSCGDSPPPVSTDDGSVAVAILPPTGAPGAATPPTVPVPAGSAQVRFQLRGPDRPAVDLTAELEAVATGEIRRWPVDEAPANDPPGPGREAAGSAAFTVTVPVYAVPPGAEHRLTLWAGDAEVVGRYEFRVVVP